MTDGALRELGALPTGPELGTLLDGLLDRGVTAVVEPRPTLPGRQVQVVASYVDEAKEIRAVVMLDLPLGTGLGAALALVPAPRVAEAVRSGTVPEDLADNTREVLNIAASLFNCGDVHLKLADVAVAPTPVDAATVTFLRVPRRRADLRVTVPGYGEGIFAVITTTS